MIEYLKNIWYYIQGNIRYKLYYGAFAFLLPEHIEEQITARIKSMDIKCYEDGQCKMCGCNTTALQMCNRACDKPCYPPMLTKKIWNKLKTTTDVEHTKVGISYKGNDWYLDENHKFYIDELEQNK